MIEFNEIICDSVKLGNWSSNVENENILFKYNGNVKAIDITDDASKRTPIVNEVNGVLQTNTIKANKVKLSNWKIYQNASNVNQLKFDYNNKNEFVISPSS